MDISLVSLSAITVTFLCLSLLILYRKTKPHKTLNLPPGKMGWPMIGETADFSLSCMRGKLRKFIVDRLNQCSPDVFRTSILGGKVAVFYGPKANKFLFSNEDKVVESWFPDSIHKILLTDYADSETPKQRVRAIAYEFLRPAAIKKYIQTMDSVASQHLDQEWAPNQTLTVYPMAKKLMFSLSCRIFMGIEDKNEVKRLEEQFETVALGLPIDLPGTKLRRSIRAANVMRSEIQKNVRQRRLSQNKDNSGNANMLSYLLSATDSEGKLLNEEEIAYIIVAVLVASQQFSSSLITNLMYFLADNPVVFDTALKEQLEIRKSKGDGKELLSWEDAKRMKYGWKTVNEVLRIESTAFGFFRQALHDFTFAGYTIPKGWKIFSCPSALHKDPKYYPNPEKFDPSRFEGNGPLPFTFTPFGGGPRMCPGAEFVRHVALVFMHNLLIKFKWEKLIPTEKIIYVAGVAGPEKGLPVKLQRCRLEQETDDS